ncbi:MAG: anti-sigma factor [Acidimicrobiia bacterium]|nr:anti-sigma factor [Acidimicrobiia bacterium]
MTYTNEQHHDLMAAYAMDAVDERERAALWNAIDQDAALRSELAAYHETLAVLAAAVEDAPSTPSPAVWNGIQQAIAGDEAAAEAPSFTPVREVKRRRFTTRILGAVAGTAMVAAAFFGIQLASVDAPDLASAATELAAQSSSRTVSLTDSGGLAVDVVLGADGVGYVYADQLPALNDGRTYQLWAINDNGVISAGIFGTDGIAPFHTDGAVTGFAITEEVAGGVEASQNDPVAVWLDA